VSISSSADEGQRRVGWTSAPELLTPSRYRFHDRHEAGRALAERLRSYAGRDDVIVLALPRGGVPVGYEVASALGVPLDVFLVRKLGVPGHEELAFGAIATGGLLVLDRDLARQIGLSSATIEQVIAREAAELERRERAYRGERPPPDLRGRTVILVDDGLATGSTMTAAAAAVAQQEPARVIVAVPVAAADTCEMLRREADEVICLVTPSPFHAVGIWYDDFRPVDDDEVRRLLAATTRPMAGQAVAG
jgi:predicted phosphoribosyltransferase